MRKTLKFLIASGACLVMAGTGQMSAQAAMNLETDAPVAGASVAINNYYASSLNPEKELAEAFASKEVLAVAGAGQTGVSGGAQTAKPAQVPAETKAQPKETTGETEAVVRAMSKSIYDNIAISRVTNYVNVRAQASTSSEVVGKIYNNCAATILDAVDGEGGKWYHIQSGSVTGYIKAQYFVTGEEASKIAREVGTTYAKVTNTSTLRLRETPSLEGKTLDLLSADAEYEVIGEEGDFAKISVDNDLVGYVYKDYITTQVDFKQAVSVAEEQQQKAEEEKLKQEANAAIENLEQVKKKAEEESRAAETTAAAKETTAAAKETTKAPETSYSGTIEANPSESKAAIYGHDANWGRILCAMGYSGAQFDPEKVDLFFESAAGKMQIIKDGVAVDYSEEEATKILSEPAVTAIADIKMGDAEATAWGCDLTYDYVKINADYRS